MNEQLPAWVYKRWHTKNLELLGRIDGQLVRHIAYRFKCNKTSADDHVVIEMITALDEDSFDFIAEAYKLRFLNHVSDNEEKAWEMHMVQCILKSPTPTILAHLDLLR